MTFIESSRIFNAPQQQKITEILSDIFQVEYLKKMKLFLKNQLKDLKILC